MSKLIKPGWDDDRTPLCEACGGPCWVAMTVTNPEGKKERICSPCWLRRPAKELARKQGKPSRIIQL